MLLTALTHIYSGPGRNWPLNVKDKMGQPSAVVRAEVWESAPADIALCLYFLLHFDFPVSLPFELAGIILAWLFKRK